jgi:hypothetical protein
MQKIFRSLMVLGVALVAGSGLAASGWTGVSEDGISQDGCRVECGYNSNGEWYCKTVCDF